MKSFLLGITVVCSLSAVSLTTDTVYICKGKSSKKYHLKKNCRGLSNCSTAISEVTRGKAKEMGRGICGWED
tara:strand:+ start:3632 stop:3847 length:216 start_codon:yes stop_codon:yes gene_type:complete